MDTKKIDVTSEFDPSSLTPIEIDAVLRTTTSGATINPDHPHIAIYDNCLFVKHKKDGSKILNIFADRTYWNKNKEKIRKNIREAISPPETKIITQVVYSAGGDLSIPTIKWKDEFQLGRIPDGNPKPSELCEYYPCLFQYSVPWTNLPWLDNHRADEYFKKRFLPLVPLLMQHCTTRLLFYPKGHGRKLWTVEVNIAECKPESRYGSIGYNCKTQFSHSSFFQHPDCETINLPVDGPDLYWLASHRLSDGYRAYENLNDDLKGQFLLGCEWLNKALNASDSTDQTLFLMIMLEIFLPKDKKVCTECGQQIYAIAERFRTYIPSVIGEEWTDNFETILKNLYSLRSKIAHHGIGVAHHILGMTPHQWEQRNQVEFLFKLARQFLVSWLYHQKNNNRG